VRVSSNADTQGRFGALSLRRAKSGQVVIAKTLAHKSGSANGRRTVATATRRAAQKTVEITIAGPEDGVLDSSGFFS